MSKDNKDIDLVKENETIKAKLDAITNANALKENEKLKEQLKEAEAKQKELESKADAKDKEISKLNSNFEDLSKKIEAKLENDKEIDVEEKEKIIW